AAVADHIKFISAFRQPIIKINRILSDALGERVMVESNDPVFIVFVQMVARLRELRQSGKGTRGVAGRSMNEEQSFFIFERRKVGNWRWRICQQRGRRSASVKSLRLSIMSFPRLGREIHRVSRQSSQDLSLYKLDHSSADSTQHCHLFWRRCSRWSCLRGAEFDPVMVSRRQRGRPLG